MNRQFRRALCLLILVSLMLMCGCGTGGTGRNRIETTRESMPAEYKMTQVRRGDIRQSETVRLSYFPAKQETLSFPVSGLYYDSVNVEVGDTVSAGDTLATLECSEIDSRIASYEAEKAALSLEIERSGALMDLLNQRGGAEERRRGYEVAIRDAESQIAVIDAQLEEERGIRDQRVLIASMDGTVTFARDVAPGETSVVGRPVITVTDLSYCAFSASVLNPDALDPEKIYTITVDGTDYDLKLSSAAELGIEEKPRNEKSERTTVYFRTLTPSVNLNEDSTGRFTVVIDSREDVLYLPIKALTAVDGKTCVYVPDENGLCSIRYVTAGLITGQSAEIIEGLEEGEDVIVF